MEWKVTSCSPEDTFSIAKKLGSFLDGGEIICLYGELGAGKTVFAKGLGEALNVNEQITSPTFTIIQEYNGHTSRKAVKFIHMDLYRLQHPEEAEVIGVPDYFTEDCICLIEWPEKAEDLLPGERLEIKIEGSGEDSRSITFRPLDGRWKEFLDSLV